VSVGDVTIAQRMEPDPAEIFAVQLTPSIVDSAKFTFELSEEGMLSTSALERRTKRWRSRSDDLKRGKHRGGDSRVRWRSRAAETGVLPGSCHTAQKLRADRRGLLLGQANTNGTPKEAIDLMLSGAAGARRRIRRAVRRRVDPDHRHRPLAKSRPIPTTRVRRPVFTRGLAEVERRWSDRR